MKSAKRFLFISLLVMPLCQRITAQTTAHHKDSIVNLDSVMVHISPYLHYETLEEKTKMAEIEEYKKNLRFYDSIIHTNGLNDQIPRKDGNLYITYDKKKDKFIYLLDYSYIKDCHPFFSELKKLIESDSFPSFTSAYRQGKLNVDVSVRSCGSVEPVDVEIAGVETFRIDQDYGETQAPDRIKADKLLAYIKKVCDLKCVGTKYAGYTYDKYVNYEKRNKIATPKDQVDSRTKFLFALEALFAPKG